MKRILCISLSAFLLSAAPVAAADSEVPDSMRRWQNDKPVMPVEFWEIIAQCETGGDRGVTTHATRSYITAFGMNRRTASTWSDFNALSRRGARALRRLSWEEQRVIAERIAFKGHFNKRQGRYVWPVGVRGWGCFKIRPSAQALLCRSRHPLVQRWKRGC
jgi:hypothetical protein